MNKILVALDGSKRAAVVLAAAHDLAVKTGAKLVLVRVVSLTTELPYEAYMANTDPSIVLREHAEHHLKEAAKTLPPHLVARVHVIVGQPWQSICGAAIEEDVDLIMIGSHGYELIDRVIGTTAARVVNHADRSVLVVRALDRLLT